MLDNGTVYFFVTDPMGIEHELPLDVYCMDFEAPTLRAGINGTNLRVEASDALSGIAAVFVNDELYTTLDNGELNIRIDNLTDDAYLYIDALDNAGNWTDYVVLANPFYEEESEPTPTPDTGNDQHDEHCPADCDCRKNNTSGSGSGSSSGGGGSGASSGSGGSKNAGSSAQTPTSSETPAPTTEPITKEDGTGFTQNGNSVTRDLLYDKYSNKQFITIETRNGETFYLVIDYHSGKSENESADAAKALPPVDEGQTFMVGSTAVKEGKTTPPKHYTEDTLLSAMEVAGAKEMPEDAERKGLGTPATRAAILEKLVATGFVERKKSKKTVSLIPTHAGISLITVLPEQLQSPLMTAEWEHRLKEIERGEESPETFMQGIRDMVCELVKTYKTVLGADVLFPSGRAVVGKCPRCGSDVTESKKGYFCERNDCHFGLWRDNRFLTAKKINLTKKMAEALLKDRKTYASGIFSEKTGKTYDAYIVLEDDGQRSAYKLEFSKENRK